MEIRPATVIGKTLRSESVRDLTDSTYGEVVEALGEAPPGTWLEYYRGINPHLADQIDGSRHTMVAALMRNLCERGAVTLTLRRIEAGDMTHRGVYSYLAKTLPPAPPKPKPKATGPSGRRKPAARE